MPPIQTKTADRPRDIRAPDPQAPVAQPTTTTPQPTTQPTTQPTQPPLSASGRAPHPAQRALDDIGADAAAAQGALGGVFAHFDARSASAQPASTSPAAKAASSATGTGNTTAAAKGDIKVLYADKQFAALHDFVMTSVNTIASEHREWDKLSQIKSFAAAVAFVTKGTPLHGGTPANGAPTLMARFPGAQEQRAICHLLLLLMPHEDRTERPMLPNGSRGAPQDLFRPFPDSIIARSYDDFALKPGDLPKVSGIFTQHLVPPGGAPALMDQIFKKGQQGLFLASKVHCPGAFLQDRKDKNPATLDKKQQSGHEGDPILVKIDDIVMVDGQRMARVHVPAQHKVWLGDDGACHQGHEVLGKLDVVTDVKGEPVRGADGKPKPILIPVEHLASYLMAEGSSSRGLDLARPEDRCVALTYAETLKTTWYTDRNGIGKNLFDWLEQADGRTPREDVERIRELAREAGFQAVVRYTTHPRRTHFKLDVDPKELAAVKAGEKKREQADWQTQAYLILQETGVCRDGLNHYQIDKATTANVHEMAWTSHFLKTGVIGGSLDCMGSSAAYDRLSKTFLEPLGVVSTTNIAEGHGASLVRVLGQPDDNGVIQAGEPMKVKLNEFIVGLRMSLSSGRGPAAQYMENWGGYLKISGVVGKAIDFATAQQRLDLTTSLAGTQ